MAGPHRRLLAGHDGPRRQVEVPCRKATEALLAAHVCQLIASDHGELHGGEGFYDRFYIRDGAYQMMELEEAGLRDAAAKAIGLYSRSRNGPTAASSRRRTQFDANGQALWTFGNTPGSPATRPFCERVYPQMLRAAQWTMQARREAPADSPFAGLLPAAPADGEIPLGRQAPHRRLRFLESARDAVHGRRREDVGQDRRRETSARRGPGVSRRHRRRLEAHRGAALPAHVGRKTARTGATPRRSGPRNCSRATTRAWRP